MFKSIKIFNTGLPLLLVILLVIPVSADRGMIPLTPAILEESEQNAIIAWNGSEEILILSTNIRASNETVVLELLPLPSKPEIERASMESFNKLIEIVNRKERPAGFFGAEKAGFSIVLQKRIGAHFLTVVQINNSVEFTEWFKGYISGMGYETGIPQSFSELIDNYVTRGHNHLAIDIINVTSDERTLDPILYRFKTDKLYYPLKITAPIESETRINLFILSKGIVEQEELRRFGFWGAKGYGDYIHLSKSELKEVNPQISEILDEAYFTNARYIGNTEKLNQDFEIKEIYTPTFSDFLIKFLEKTMVFQCFAAFSALGSADGFGLIFFSVLIFSVLLGFPAIFYIAESSMNAFLKGKVEKRRSFISHSVAAILTAFFALNTGFFAVISAILLFFFGISFGIHFSVKLFLKLEERRNEGKI